MSADAAAVESKKRKLDDDDEAVPSDPQRQPETTAGVDLRSFAPAEVVKAGRLGCVRGTLNGAPALLVLERDDFAPADLLTDKYCGPAARPEKLLENDAYARFVAYPRRERVKAVLISPCTQKHVDKYRAHASRLVRETPERYRDVTLKHLLEDSFDVRWVYNILEGTTEAERVVYRGDPGSESEFVLLPDLHWAGQDPDRLHLLAIPFKRDIRSVRDLDATHLPLLRRIRSKSTEVVKQKYGIPADRLRLYFHYQPTFYHLHVHVTHLQHEAPGTLVEKAILLDTVIDNIELNGDHYKRATIPFTVREIDTLFAKFKAAGVFDDSENCKNGNSDKISPEIN